MVETTTTATSASTSTSSGTTYTNSQSYDWGFCPYRLPCGICKYLEKPCVKDIGEIKVTFNSDFTENVK